MALKILCGFALTLAWVLLLGGTAWAATAMVLHLNGAARVLALTALAASAAAVAVLLVQGRPGSALGAGLLATLVVGLWYQTIRPQADRDWAPELAHGVGARLDGDIVHLSNLRDFDWETPDHARTERWFDRTHDLADLREVEFFTSVWNSEAIAHLLVSFGFADGRRTVFSAEIRRSRDQEFSEIGGFFRQFELILLGASERDILRLRTDIRKERVSRWPLQLNETQMRELFLSYVMLAQDLQAEPRFYNTLTANCTTMVFRLARSFDAALPMDWRLLLSGYVPEYLAQIGVLQGQGEAGAMRASALITPLGQSRPAGADYSAWIRGDRVPERPED